MSETRISTTGMERTLLLWPGGGLEVLLHPALSIICHSILGRWVGGGTYCIFTCIFLLPVSCQPTSCVISHLFGYLLMGFKMFYFICLFSECIPCILTKVSRRLATKTCTRKKREQNVIVVCHVMLVSHTESRGGAYRC